MKIGRNKHHRTLRHKVYIHKNDNAMCFYKSFHIQRVLVYHPNVNLESLLSLTILIQEITKTFPECKIDLIVQHLDAKLVFKNYDGIHSIAVIPFGSIKFLQSILSISGNIYRQTYEMYIQTSAGSWMGKLMNVLSSAPYTFGIQHQKRLGVLMYEAMNFRDDLAYLIPLKNKNPIPQIKLKLDTDELEKGKSLLNRIFMDDKGIIFFYRGDYRNNLILNNLFENLWGSLRIEFLEFEFIEILLDHGRYHSSIFSTTDIRFVSSILAHTKLFIGVPGLYVSLASSVEVPVVCLYNHLEKIQYYSNDVKSESQSINKIDLPQFIKQIGNKLSN